MYVCVVYRYEDLVFEEHAELYFTMLSETKRKLIGRTGRGSAVGFSTPSASIFRS